MPNSIIIVGAGPNLGAAVARRFGREGLSVGLVSRATAEARGDRADLQSTRIDSAYAAADIRDAEALVGGDRLAGCSGWDRSRCWSTRRCRPVSS